jgi:very-short-patch-repair endonuclease
MKYPFNNPRLKKRRKELRKNQTDAEYILWQKLRNKHLGKKFYRQYSVGPYILDFFCTEARLAIELDGSTHSKEEIAFYDQERTAFLKEQGIRVVRFWNKEIIDNFENTLKKILLLIAPA